MQTDTLIVGCGIAGAAAALELARDRERQITLITRADRAEDSSSSMAQGGIAGTGPDDTPRLLEQDVLLAGAGLSRPEAVRILAEEGPPLLDELLIERVGIEFDRDGRGELVMALEGAHSRRRILHVGDLTGRAVMRGLLEQLRGHSNVRMLTGYTAVDLLTFPHHAVDPLQVYEPPACHGAYALSRSSGKVEMIVAGQTVLAAGGLGQIYLNTTNPSGARGDGLAMAYRAGARVVNVEYVQFHPTALHMAGPVKTLISEAVRGEGGVLLTPRGEPFMERYEPEKKELGPRDVVARAIYTEMINNGYPYVLLDIASRKPGSYIRKRFPQIHADCLAQGVDIAEQPIPVVPAAHYACGGVLVDADGRTILPGLYAVGEVACSGVHGANRLASTSLLEGLVWGTRAARDIRAGESAPAQPEDRIPPWDDSGLTHDADPALIHGDMRNIRNLMWHYVGLSRNRYRLDRALRELRGLWHNIEEFYRRAHLTDALVGLHNAVLCAQVVTRAALQNSTSRGCHYREDDPR